MPTSLITGANRGLGLEFARQYVADGWQVYAACRNPKSASELHRLADARGHSLQILALDVSQRGSKRRPRNSTGEILTSPSKMPGSAEPGARLLEISITRRGRRCSM